MTAPVATPRGTPTGIKLEDGFSTKITMSLNPTIELWEKTVKPPGLDGGDAVNTTTMHNVTYRTMAPRKLKTLTEITSTCAYDPLCYVDLLSMINRKQTLTVTFPDGTTLAFYGYLKSFEPNDVSEGNMPEATVHFVPTNADPVTGAEQAAVLVNVSGT